MSTATGDYLRALERELGPFARRRELVAEVAAHLQESAEQQLDRDGVDADEATARAITRLGTPGEIAAAFARQGEPLAVPTGFTRAGGWVAIVALPLWAATFALFQAAQVADGGRDWEGLPQTLFMLGMGTMLLATIGFLVAAMGLSRRVGATGRLGGVAIALLGLGIPLVGFAWLIPAWTSVLALALGLFGWRLKERRSQFATPMLVAAAGPLAAFASFWVLAGAGLDDLWGVPYGIMLLSALAFAIIGLRLVREPDMVLPASA